MEERVKIEQAKDVFQRICAVLDKNEWTYKSDPEKLEIEIGVQGEDLPIDLTFRVEPERMLVMIISAFPYTIQEDKRLEVAMAVVKVNFALVHGCFDYDLTTGRMFFRMTNSFLDSRLSDEVFEYMLYCACGTVDDYNDKFLLLSKGLIDIEHFLASSEE